MGAESLKALRGAMRRRRASLRQAVIAELSARIAGNFWRIPEVARRRRLAGYFAVGGEVDCRPLMIAARARGREIFLPVLHGRNLVFGSWDLTGSMASNRFGIPEPAAEGTRFLPAVALDVVLAPLLAFDRCGHRLGMGGGFYDRTLRLLTQRGRWRRPLYVGLAYEFQRVDTLPRRSWDVPLHAVVTEQGAHIF